MTWSDALREAFPHHHRDDEPSSLRDDIADELADHLEAALAQERSRCNDEAEARQAVLRRFGDPQRITRRLWFDAMKGEIMTQRVLVAAVTLMSLACLSVAGLAWRSVRKSDENNRAVVAQLAEMVKSLKKESGEELVDLEVQCILDKPDGLPAEGCQVAIDGPAINAGERVYFKRDSDTLGIVRFGGIRPGAYQLTVASSSGWYSSGQIAVQRNGEHREEVICPSAPRETAEVEISVDWPEDLRDRELALVAMFNPDDARLTDVSGRIWHWPSKAQSTRTGLPTIVVNEKGQLYTELVRQYPESYGVSREFSDNELKSTPHVRWLIGDYKLTGICVLELSKPSGGEETTVIKNIGAFYFKAWNLQQFTATAGQTNRWKIQVPPPSMEGWSPLRNTAKAPSPKGGAQG